jgi:hypothetical protein
MQTHQGENYRQPSLLVFEGRLRRNILHVPFLHSSTYNIDLNPCGEARIVLHPQTLSIPAPFHIYTSDC